MIGNIDNDNDSDLDIPHMQQGLFRRHLTLEIKKILTKLQVTSEQIPFPN